MRGRGLRPLEILNPTAPGFVEEAHRQSRAVANSPQEKDDQDFVDSIAFWNNK
jgi:hypothetical protein